MVNEILRLPAVLAPEIDRFIRFPELCAIFSMARSRAHELIKQGVLPQPVKIGRSSVYLLSEVRAAQAALISARDGAKSE